MKKKILLGVLGVSVLSFLIYYGPKAFFLFLLMITTPQKKELTKQEIDLFNELKKEYNLKKIDRTPEFKKDYEKDSLIYTIYIDDFKCDNKNNINFIGKGIIKKANKKLELESKFYYYEIIIYCDNIQYREHLIMNRDSLNKGLYK